jgi:hypothetical protein
VWPDKQALFPWEEDFNSDWKFKQPLLDRDNNFKFREERNAAVFTTRQVLEGLPILQVSHETDGDWLFLCGTTTDLNDFRIACLQEITKRDDTINELYEPKYGWAAWREVVGGKWQKEENEVEENSEEEEE